MPLYVSAFPLWGKVPPKAADEGFAFANFSSTTIAQSARLGGNVKNDKITAVIVAAGAGRRMNGPVRKQYMDISGYPVLYYTLKAFEESCVDAVIIVTAGSEQDYVRHEIVEKYGFKKVTRVCEGGRERYDSVYAGILKADTEYIMIHDGVRMLVTPQLINRCADVVRKTGACVTAVPVKDTIKEAEKVQDGADAGKPVIKRTPDRANLYQVQTPQCFRTKIILDAFEKYYSLPEESRIPVTDDSVLVETYTEQRVVVAEGDYRNIKITTIEDVGLAEYFLNNGSPTQG